MAVTTPFETLFAVPMHCEACVKDISDSVYKLNGIAKVEANLKDQLVSIEGTAAPSAIVAAIQATGRDAILRGSGGSDSAAVCILETHTNTELDRQVRGLARMVQVAPKMTLIDLTIRGLTPGTYWASIRQTGDISNGAISTLGIWRETLQKFQEGAISSSAAPASAPPVEKPRGLLGTLEVGKDGIGSVFMDRPIQIWEMIGRGVVVSRELKDGEGRYEKNDADTLVGVIARSAGVWDNDKTVCSCSGKTLWEERKDEVKKGML